MSTVSQASDFFSSNSGLWNFCVTAATLFMVIITFFSLMENIKARKSQFQPNIIVDFIIEYTYVLQLVVKNTGNSPALEIKIDIDPQIEHPFGDIKFLSPNSEMRCSIFYLIKKDMNISENYNFNISYLDIYKKEHTSNYQINIKPLLDSRINYKPDSLEQIASGLNALAGSININQVFK